MLEDLSKSEDAVPAARDETGVTRPAVARSEKSPAIPAEPARDAEPDQKVAASAEKSAPKASKGSWRKRLLLSVLGLGIIGAGGYFGYQYWTEGRFFVSTDDAYLSADMSILSPKINGYVDRLLVQENDVVAAGQPIVVLDTGDYDLALKSAEAKIATQRASIERLRAQREASVAAIGEADATRAANLATLGQSELDLRRASDLVTSGVGAKSQRDNAQSARDSAAAKVQGSDAEITSAKANVTVLDAQILEAQHTVAELEIARDKAARDLTFTTLKAPYAGIVGNLSVQPGDYVSAGRRLAAMVPLTNVYIDANFKETQLHDIAIGSKVRVDVDSMPGRDLKGTVVSISPASGSVFSLLPTDNATGNFTKVVQRVPVRISIDEAEQLAGKLRPGLSAVVAVDTRTAPAQPATKTAAAN